MSRAERVTTRCSWLPGLQAHVSEKRVGTGRPVPWPVTARHCADQAFVFLPFGPVLSSVLHANPIRFSLNRKGVGSHLTSESPVHACPPPGPELACVSPKCSACPVICPLKVTVE